MKVSVIVPNYNHARYLKERLDSILAQTVQDIEVIPLDDCSSDNSMEVLAAYENNPKVRHVVRNTTNSGSPFLQWQRGFELAAGEYVWIAESDDVAENRMKGSPDKPALYKGDGVYDGRKFALQRMLYRNVVYNASMVLFRKSALKGVSPEFRTYRSGGDWIFWFDIMIQGSIAEIPQSLNSFRQHEGKVTVRADREGQNLLENARCVRHMCSELNLTKLQMKSVRGRMTLRLKKKRFPGEQQVKEKYPEFYDGTWGDIVFYELDKIFGITGLLR